MSRRSINVSYEYDFEDLYEECWGNALHTLNIIEKEDLEEEFMMVLNNAFEFDIPSMTEVNDWIAEDDFVIEDMKAFGYMKDYEYDDDSGWIKVSDMNENEDED